MRITWKATTTTTTDDDRCTGHSTTRIDDPDRRTNFTWCQRCRDWFEPASHAADAPEPRQLSADELLEAADNYDGRFYDPTEPTDMTDAADIAKATRRPPEGFCRIIT